MVLKEADKRYIINLFIDVGNLDGSQGYVKKVLSHATREEIDEFKFFISKDMHNNLEKAYADSQKNKISNVNSEYGTNRERSDDSEGYFPENLERITRDAINELCVNDDGTISDESAESSENEEEIENNNQKFEVGVERKDCRDDNLGFNIANIKIVGIKDSNDESNDKENSWQIQDTFITRERSESVASTITYFDSSAENSRSSSPILNDDEGQNDNKNEKDIANDVQRNKEDLSSLKLKLLSQAMNMLYNYASWFNGLPRSEQDKTVNHDNAFKRIAKIIDNLTEEEVVNQNFDLYQILISKVNQK